MSPRRAALVVVVASMTLGSTVVACSSGSDSSEFRGVLVTSEDSIPPSFPDVPAGTYVFGVANAVTLPPTFEDDAVEIVVGDQGLIDGTLGGRVAAVAAADGTLLQYGSIDPSSWSSGAPNGIVTGLPAGTVEVRVFLNDGRILTRPPLVDPVTGDAFIAVWNLPVDGVHALAADGAVLATRAATFVEGSLRRG